MKTLLGRRTMLIALGITTAAFLADYYSRSGAPTAASAALSAASSQPILQPLPPIADVRSQIERACAAAEAVSVKLPPLTRDVFVPEGYFAPPPPPPEPEPPIAIPDSAPAIEVAPAAPVVPPIQQRRTLQVVILGPRPLVQIDGVILQVGDRIDGYTVAEIERDAVHLERDGERVTLRVPREAGGNHTP